MVNKNQPGKRGAKPYFTGSRQKLLEDYLDEYISLKGQNRNKFWFDFFGQWWKNYPWKLNDKDEPPVDDPEKMKELALVQPDERNKKSEVEAAVKTRVKQWFAYQSQHHVSRADTHWSHLLQRLHESSNPKPRKRSTVQQFMFENPSIVDAAFISAHGEARGMDGVERMNRRHDLAKRILYGEQHKSKIPDLEKRAREHHELEVSQWSMALEDIELAPDVNVARDSLFSAIHPLLKVIGVYTGCYVTLLAAAVPSSSNGEKDYFSAVHHVPEGKASRLNWTQWDSDGFRLNVARQFKKYIKHMESPTDVANSSSNSVGDKSAASTLAAPATPTTVPSTLSLKPGLTSDSTTTATKRSATGKYKAAKAVYTEPGDSDEWSDGTSKSSDGHKAKRQRMTITTRSRSNVSGAGSSDHDSGAEGTVPPSTTSGLTPNRNTPSIDESAPPTRTLSTDGPRNPSNAHEEAPTADTPSERPVLVPTMEISLRLDTPEDTTVVSAPGDTGMIERSPSSKTAAPFTAKTPVPKADTLPPPAPAETPSVPRNTRLTAVPGVNRKTGTPEVLLPPSTMVPKFLAIAPKKSKTSVYSYLSNAQDPDFRSLLQVYVGFENAAMSLKRTGSLSTTSRPTQIPWWIQLARSDTAPSLPNLQDYGASVIEWWSSLQPSWRILEYGKDTREEGSLDYLCQPGINGLLNIVILAYWWSNCIGSSSGHAYTEGERYRWFANDVSWVLSKLVEAM